MPNKEEAQVPRSRRRLRLERGSIGNGEDRDGRSKRNERGLVEQIGRERGDGCVRHLEISVRDELDKTKRKPVVREKRRCNLEEEIRGCGVVAFWIFAEPLPC